MRITLQLALGGHPDPVHRIDLAEPLIKGIARQLAAEATIILLQQGLQYVRLYISFPMALAAAIGLEPGEEVHWELLDRGELHLVRPNATQPSTKARAK